MWRMGLYRCVLTLIVCGLAVPAHGEHRERKRTERAEIINLEGRWRQAELAEDVTTMDKLLSDEFVGVTASGQVVTKIQQLDRMRTRSLDIKKMELSDTKIKISGNLAVVTSMADLDGTADGSPLQGAFRYTRVYQRVPGDGWKITNFECMYGCCLSRIHQFEKVEQFFVTSPDNDASWAALEEMLTNAEDFYQALGLPYQVSTSGTCLLVLP